jgi:hypothetical protein
MGMTDNTIDTFRVFNIYTHKVENRNNVHQLSVDKDQTLRYYISRINTFMNKFPHSIIRDAMIDLFGNIPENDELSFRIDIPLIDRKGKYTGEYSSIPIESIDYKVETYANLSRVEELISDTIESEDSLITD